MDPWIELARRACDHAGVRFNDLRVEHTWKDSPHANAVFAVDARYFLKVYGPQAPNQYHVERAMLEALERIDAIPAPHLVATGIAEEAPYAIITRVPGKTAEEVWCEVPRRSQLALADQLGTIVAAIHALSPGTLTKVEQRYGGRHYFAQTWRERVAEQIKSATDIPIEFRSTFVDFLEGYAQAQIETGTTVTHRELAHNHLYLDRQGGLWSIAGLIDWADSTIGPPEWDTAFVWFWTFTRDREAMRRFLRSRHLRDPLPETLGKRCLAAILQTYEGPALWKEILAHHGELAHDPIGASVDLLFPADTFG